MDDKTLRSRVIAALAASPVPSTHIGVIADNGVAILTGHVLSDDQKAAAVEVARKVEGVTSVIDELEAYAAVG